MNKTGDVTIRLTNISKRYTIHHEKPTLVERVGIIGPNGMLLGMTKKELARGAAYP